VTSNSEYAAALDRLSSLAADAAAAAEADADAASLAGDAVLYAHLEVSRLAALRLLQRLERSEGEK